MTCQSCGATIHADDVNLKMGIAKCRYCQAVFTFGPSASSSSDASKPKRERIVTEKPNGFEIYETPHAFVIQRHWRSLAAIPLGVFCLLWNGFLVVWFVIGFSLFNEGKSMAIVMLLFPIFHVAAGVALTYSFITMLINKTSIEVNEQQLTVRHHPLWAPGNKSLNTLDIQQLFCKQKTSHNNNKTSYSYEVHAQTNDGKSHKLVTQLRESDHATYIEQQIERALGLKDKAITGEHV